MYLGEYLCQLNIYIMKRIVSLIMYHLTLNDVLDSLPSESIPDYFSNKNIFITGATGFLGKILVEKILRTCSNVRKVYCLIRPGPKLSFDDKCKKLINSEVFDLIRLKNKAILSKIVPVEGDISQINLGISRKHWNKLIKKVHIIYHLAGTASFKNPLNEAIIINVRGTREVCKLALEGKKVIALVYFSTVYCFPNEKKIYETYYKSPVDWKEAIQIAENIDEELLFIITSKFCGSYPDTYTFTKALSENVIKDLCDGAVSTIILRPSIVLPTYREPIKGWVENLNGPTGIVFYISMGIIRIILGRKDGIYDMVPADIVISAVIKATWIQSFMRYQCGFWYNITNYKKPIKTEVLCRIIRKTVSKLSLNCIWYPTVSATNSFFMYELNFFVFQIVPALIIDFVLFLSAKKSRMLKLQRRIYDKISFFNYCASKSWSFGNTNFISLNNYLLECDKNLFTDEDYDLENAEYNLSGVLTALKSLQVNYMEDFHDNVARLKRLKLLHQTVKFICSFAGIGIILRLIHLYFLQNLFKFEDLELVKIKFS